MKRALKPKLNVPSAEGVKGKKRGKISIPLNEIITAIYISYLEDEITELDHYGQWRLDNSLWSQWADQLAGRLSI
jgi:hypothetical protein